MIGPPPLGRVVHCGMAGHLVCQNPFPWFQKTITKGYVSQDLAGERVARIVMDQGFAQPGRHGRWSNRQRAGAQPCAQPLSATANTTERAARPWELSAGMVGLRLFSPSGNLIKACETEAVSNSGQ